MRVAESVHLGVIDIYILLNALVYLEVSTQKVKIEIGLRMLSLEFVECTLIL